MKYCALIITLLAQTASADRVETPWMARGDRVAVVVSLTTDVRGFHPMSVEIRQASPLEGSAGKLLATREVLKPERLAWLSSHGEYDLYRDDVARRLRQLEVELETHRFQPLTPLVLDGAGRLPMGSANLIPTIDAALGDSSVSLAHGDREQLVFRLKTPAVELSMERSHRLNLQAIVGAAITADARWLALTLESETPVHAEVATVRQVVVVPLGWLLKRLKLPADLLGAPDGQG